MSSRSPHKPADGRYDDGLDDDPPETRDRATRIAATTRMRPVEDDAPVRARWLDVQLMSVPLFAGFVFGICAALAAGSVEFTLRRFAEEAGLNSLIFVAVPALFAMLFAIVIYQNAKARISRIAQSVSRGLLVALLTWASFSALATWTWCLPANYSSCYGNFLLVSGLVGGGPMLIAALVAGALVGWLIQQQRLGWIME